jgi:carbon storage regulator CsrA
VFDAHIAIWKGFPMLVLSRRKHESVVIGDEVTLTVEEISGSDHHQRIVGAAVRLGFQSPRYVSIDRDEVRELRSRAGHAGRPAKPPPPPPTGKIVEIPDAQVRLRIQVPPRIPVCCNGRLTAATDAEVAGDGEEPRTAMAVYRVTCHKNDRITICNNITIAALDVHRFVVNERKP